MKWTLGTSFKAMSMMWGRKMKSWTLSKQIGTMSVIWFILSIRSEIPTTMVAYSLTGIIFILIGIMFGQYEKLNTPKEMRVLLQHRQPGLPPRGYLLTVMISPNGEIYAPKDASKRILEPVDDAKTLSMSTLGSSYWATQDKGVFRILGETYHVLIEHS